MYESEYHSGNLSDHSFLITGGAGFIGSNIVEYLLKFGAKKVRVLDNLATGKESNLLPFKAHPSFEFILGDISDLKVCRQACKGVDFVSHQAALGSVPRSILEPWNTNEVNAGGFVNVISAAKDAGVKKFVYASSSSVYGDEQTLPKVEGKIGRPLSPYAVSKYTNELYAAVFHRAYNMNVSGLRYFNIFGPKQDPNGQYAAVIPLFVSKILKQEAVFIDGDGEQTRDFTFIENAVQANIKAIFAENKDVVDQVFNIAVGANFSVNQLYREIQTLLNSTHPASYRAARAGDVRNSLADISKARKLLNYNPEFSFERGLGITVEYFKALYS
jgi:UDP-N-acetylglucosamine/UDP-N-acetylgalactosamine 4-epimerase